MPAAVAAAIDAVCIVVFVLLGRNAHDEGSAVTGTLAIAAPFLIALAVGWIMAFRIGWRPVNWRTGLLLWVTTIVVGMNLRRTLFDRSTAVAFVIVATLFLALLLIGWRLVASRLGRGTPST